MLDKRGAVQNWSKKKLIKEIKRLKKRKKYGLVWENKPEDVVDVCKEKLPVVKEIRSKEMITDKNKPVNLLIEGDNNGEQKPFYVDFIIKLEDESIGLFDTKVGITQKVAGTKIDGLYEYIKSENKKGKKLFGGITTNTDRNYCGRWIYFDKTSKNCKNGDYSNWKDLEL